MSDYTLPWGTVPPWMEQVGKFHTRECLDAATDYEGASVGDREGGCICDGYAVYRMRLNDGLDAV